MSAPAVAQTLPHRPDTERPAMTAQTTAHSPARINPDHLAVLIVAASLTGLLAATSFLLSFAGLSAVAEWASVPWWLTWAVPVMIDSAILVYTLAALVLQARGESTVRTWCSLALWTALSVAANSLHAWTDIPALVQTIAGMTIAGLAPIAVMLATHTLTDLLVAKPDTEAASAVAELAAVTDVAPDPLVVLEEIEEAGPATTVATGVAGVRISGGDERRDVAPSPRLVAKVATPVAMSVAGDHVAVADGDERCVVAVAERPVVAVPRRSSLSAMDTERIAALARTTHLSGTKIAEELGTNKNKTCALVVQVRSDLTTTGALWAEPQAALA